MNLLYRSIAIAAALTISLPAAAQLVDEAPAEYSEDAESVNGVRVKDFIPDVEAQRLIQNAEKSAAEQQVAPLTAADAPAPPANANELVQDEPPAETPEEQVPIDEAKPALASDLKPSDTTSKAAAPKSQKVVDLDKQPAPKQQAGPQLEKGQKIVREETESDTLVSASPRAAKKTTTIKSSSTVIRSSSGGYQGRIMSLIRKADGTLHIVISTRDGRVVDARGDRSFERELIAAYGGEITIHGTRIGGNDTRPIVRITGVDSDAGPAPTSRPGRVVITESRRRAVPVVPPPPVGFRPPPPPGPGPMVW